MKKINISGLTDEQLDGWVARSQGWELIKPQLNSATWYWDTLNKITPNRSYSMYTPSTDWQQCGELIEKFKPVLHVGNVYTRCEIGDANIVATTPQEAICRAVVASVYGEYVEVNDA